MSERQSPYSLLWDIVTDHRDITRKKAAIAELEAANAPRIQQLAVLVPFGESKRVSVKVGQYGEPTLVLMIHDCDGFHLVIDESDSAYSLAWPEEPEARGSTGKPENEDDTDSAAVALLDDVA